jgi:GNAT superfamily N-acetyltransferase
MADIREISALDAHPLRRAVLRGGDPASDLHYPQDDNPDSFHLGAFDDDGTLVGVASFTPAETPYRAGVAAWQLRGMAVAPESQGSGLGAAVIAAAVDRIRSTGAPVLWCNARDTAVGFYDGLGFIVHGDGFVTPDSGLPHHVMVLDL